MVLQKSRDCQKGKMESVKLVWSHSCKSIHYWGLQMKKDGFAKHSVSITVFKGAAAAVPMSHSPTH